MSAAKGGRILRRFLQYVPELQTDAPDLFSHLSTILTVLDPSGPPISAPEAEAQNPPRVNVGRVLASNVTADGDEGANEGEAGELRKTEAATPASKTTVSGEATGSGKQKKKKKAVTADGNGAAGEKQELSGGTEKTPKKKRKSLDAAGSGDAGGLRQEASQLQGGTGEGSVAGADVFAENGVVSEPASARKKKSKGQEVQGTPGSGGKAVGSGSKETGGSSVKPGVTRVTAEGRLPAKSADLAKLKSPDSIKKKKKKAAALAAD
ncbi:hypothetical protein CLOM_g18167 [Closterium sp. NIES-68]|nr:hypothetical protein CLOM_g18132 [Closterium sp. NIES-68]GJP33642.1 hypothetical protein CLOM_g18167 [Closterium sp. NIES-68]GJP77257.1 hypothetical protein CLOP_g7679 [Closterium sp. NIES-67]